MPLALPPISPAPPSRTVRSLPTHGGPQVDGAALLDAVAGDADLLAIVVEAFVECWPDQLRALERASLAGDPPALQFAAHTLCGSLRNLCAGPAADVAARIEALASTQRAPSIALDLAELRGRLPAVQVELSTLVTTTLATAEGP